jgi:hypothetical protein
MLSKRVCKALLGCHSHSPVIEVQIRQMNETFCKSPHPAADSDQLGLSLYQGGKFQLDISIIVISNCNVNCGSNCRCGCQMWLRKTIDDVASKSK